MSKRYGRNQKRRHREQLAKCREEIQTANEVLIYSTEELASATDTIKEMVKIIKSVCEHSVALKQDFWNGDGQATSFMMPVVSLQRPYLYGGEDSRPLAIHKSVDLYALKAYLEENREKFELAVHLKYGDGYHYTYMISQTALKAASREHLLKQLLPELTGRLVDFLREKI